ACHLGLAQDLFEERLASILNEDNPIIKPYLPDEPGHPDLLAMDLDATLARFEAARRALVPRLRRLNAAEWQRPARHPEYAPYTIYVMFRHAALHDNLHLYRMEELLLAPSFSATSA
ncbi:MAG TPA: DinB family protein, partial [Bryobacterales bacterium]|nr:DinB family protein [Bryobacterales bacterium]